MIPQDIIDEIARKCRFRLDSCGFKRGVAFRAENKKPTHLAAYGFIFRLSEGNLLKIGTYEGDVYAARRALKNLT